MKILVTGGSASGKSEFAERRLLALAGAGEKYYVATMPIFGPEDIARKEKHLRIRKGRGFVTLEKPDALPSLSLPKGGRHGRFVLLEDIGNLAANEMFGRDGAAGAERRIINGVLALAARCDGIVAVSVDVARDGVLYDKATNDYVRTVEHVNLALASEFDEVYEVIAGLPARVK